MGPIPGLKVLKSMRMACFSALAVRIAGANRWTSWLADPTELIGVSPQIYGVTGLRAQGEGWR